MKKLFVLLLSLVMSLSCLGLVACGEPEVFVDITQDSLKIDLMSSKILTANITPEDAEYSVIWSSSDESIVSVNESGKIVGQKLGTATITATAGTATDTCEITVKLPNDNHPQLLLKSGVFEDAVLKLGDQVDIDNAIFFKNTEHKDATWNYSVADTSIVEIQNGKITAKAVGTTNVTISADWRGLDSEELTKTVSLTVKEFDKEESIKYSDTEYFNQYGRTYSTPEGVFLDMSGTAMEFDFYGTELSMNASVKIGTTVAVRVFIDGEKQGEFIKITGVNYQDIVLAQNLSNGAHKAKIVKASPQDIGVIAIKTVSASSFAKATAKSDLLIEFIGDSITVGYSILEGGQGSQSVHNTDASKTYAYTVAQNLKADYSIVATQGITVNSRYNLSYTMVDLYKWYSANKKTTYTHEKSPDVIVMNLGTNDGGYLNKNPGYNLASDYFVFLNQLRSLHPDSYIVLTYGMMSVNQDVVSAINTALNDLDDEKISFVEPAKPEGGGHPNQTVNDKTAVILTDYIKNLLAK